MLALVLASLWQAAAPVGGERCPSDAAVAAELARLGTTAAVARLGTPEVTVTSKRMQVALRGLDGEITGLREVAAPADCLERAAVAAVLLSAWVGAWPTDALPGAAAPRPPVAVPERAAAPSSTNVRTSEPARPVPVPAPRPAEAAALAATPALPSPPTALPPPTALARPVPIAVLPAASAASRRDRSVGIELAVLGFGTFDGDAAALGGGIQVGLRRSGPLFLAARFETAAERQRELATGTVAYRAYRFTVGAGLARRWSRVLAEVALSPQATLLAAEGRDLVRIRTVNDWGAAVDLRARLGLTLGHFLPFLFAGGSYDLVTQRLTLDNFARDVTLSRWNLIVGAGLAYRFGRDD